MPRATRDSRFAKEGPRVKARNQMVGIANADEPDLLGGRESLPPRTGRLAYRVPTDTEQPYAAESGTLRNGDYTHKRVFSGWTATGAEPGTAANPASRREPGDRGGRIADAGPRSSGVAEPPMFPPRSEKLAACVPISPTGAAGSRAGRLTDNARARNFSASRMSKNAGMDGS